MHFSGHKNVTVIEFSSRKLITKKKPEQSCFNFKKIQIKFLQNLLIVETVGRDCGHSRQ